jgi:hypothetical protein
MLSLWRKTAIGTQCSVLFCSSEFKDGYNSLTAPITSQWRNALCALQCRRDMRVSPAYVQDDKHHGGWVIILTAVGLVLLVLCLLIRLYVRLKYRSTLHKADAVLGVAGVYLSRDC